VLLVTRPAGAGDPLVADLESRGYRVIAVPTVLTRPAEVAWPMLERFDWIVLTSAAGVEALPDTPEGPRWAAVGRSTAKALRSRGVVADLIPLESNGAALGAALPDPKRARVLLVRASRADPDLPESLRHRGADVVEVVAYETIEGPEASRTELLRALREPGLAAVVFASGSAVRGFVKLGGTTGLPAITIGPRTSAAAREQGFSVAAEAVAADVEDLADAVQRAIPVEVGKDA
jgi:uroporphyrinogen-III synthase